MIDTRINIDETPHFPFMSQDHAFRPDPSLSKIYR